MVIFLNISPITHDKRPRLDREIGRDKGMKCLLWTEITSVTLVVTCCNEWSVLEIGYRRWYFHCGTTIFRRYKPMCHPIVKVIDIRPVRLSPRTLSMWFQWRITDFLCDNISSITTKSQICGTPFFFWLPSLLPHENAFLKQTRNYQINHFITRELFFA